MGSGVVQALTPWLQDALKRLQEAAPLADLELSLTDDQVKTLSTRQVTKQF